MNKTDQLLTGHVSYTRKWLGDAQAEYARGNLTKEAFVAQMDAVLFEFKYDYLHALDRITGHDQQLWAMGLMPGSTHTATAEEAEAYKAFWDRVKAQFAEAMETEASTFIAWFNTAYPET